MSPYRFSISTECLSRILNTLKYNKNFKFHPRCANLGVTHLSFADDLLLFVIGEITSVNCLHDGFLMFSEASGLQANLEKSEAYLGGVREGEKELILNHLGDIPFNYLGIPLSTRNLTIMQWPPLISKITAKISS